MNYYQDIEGEKLVFDTNRVWCAKLPALMQLFPDARVICCVRNIAWIMDSIERLVRKNAFELSAMFGFEPSNTVYTRLSRIAASDGMVGYALDALKEGFFGEHGSRLVLVEYAALVRDPSNTMQHLYGLIGEPYFAHDFDNVLYDADEFDIALGAPGLHAIRRKVEWVDRETVLPPELFERFASDMFWRQSDLNIRDVPMIRLAD